MTAAIDWPRAGRCGGAAVAWSLVVMSVCTASAGGPTVLVRDGAAVATIYVSPVREQPPQRRGRPKVPGPLEAAVEDFNYHVEKMTGARLPVVPVTAVAEVGRPGVLLGSLAAEAGAKPAASDHGDAIRLVVADGLVACGGDTDEASANAAYELLSRLGCEWVMPGEIGEVIPRRATLAIDALDVTHTPSFVVRELWYRGGSRINTPRDYAEFDLWKRRQRLGGRALVPDLGAGHEWDRLIARHREEFARNPEMLALVRDARGNLVRQGPQVESTHPGVAKLIADDIRATFAKNGWPKDRVAAFPVGPADGLGYSVSAESQLAGSGRIDPLVGDPDTTDLVVLLAHAVLEELGAEYPNVQLGFYSYSTHAGYPSRVEPDGRINVIFAPINFSRYHGVFDTNSKTRPVYRDVVERWGRRHRETGNRLAYRGYNWNLAENMAPYSMLKMLGDELPWYHAHGVRCINVEATKAWSVNGAHDFLLAKLCWDVDRPWREVLDDYCRAAYGPAAAPMADYLLAITDRQHAAGQEAGSYHALHLIYDLAFVQRMRELIDRATAAAGDGAARERVSFAMLPLEALRLYLEFHAAASRLDFPAAQRGYDAMIAHWQASYDRNSQLVGKEVPRYLERYIAQFVTQGLAHATGDYRIVTPLPDRLPTAFDPHDVGAATNLAGPDINDGLFVTTRTFSAPWDAQVLGLLRSGAVWYRFAFEPAGPAAGEGLGLFVGGVDDEVEVWLNGTRIGASGVGFSKPFVFDLTGPLLPGERNLLALKVVRNSAANEIGLGGIIRPCFLFAGPRLAQPAPHPEEKQRRVLPGGELGAGE